MSTLYVVATPIGNLGDFSPRAVETLKNSDLILVEDTRQTIKLLNYFDIKVKMVSYHKFNEKERTMEIIKELKNGKNISLVSDADTPCISDPGYILVEQARLNGIDVIGIPGCSAVITSLSVSGLDTSSFSFYGFVPTEKKSKKELFDDIRESNIKTKVLYESPKRILKLMEELKNSFPGCMVCVCSELTKIHEKSFYGKVEDVLEKMKNYNEIEKGEYVVLISCSKVNKNTEEKISLEAMIIDEMVKNNLTIKDAIKKVNDNNKDISKKELYSAGLNIKNILK